MQSADKLIDDVARIVFDPSFTRPDILRHLNAANVAIADELLLPDLGDGAGAVATVVGDNAAPLPDNFHKQIYSAVVDGVSVDVYYSILLMLQDIGPLTLDMGSVSSCARRGEMLVYQSVPTISTDIELLYYRKPVAMTDTDTSFPDGATCQSFEDALKHYAARMVYQVIERGIEGAKPHTAYHENMYKQCLLETSHFCTKVTGPQAELASSRGFGDNIFI